MNQSYRNEITDSHGTIVLVNNEKWTEFRHMCLRDGITLPNALGDLIEEALDRGYAGTKELIADAAA